MAGTLFIVAGPIGNLEDLTLRAANVLRDVSVVAAEDTRRAAILLKHVESGARTLSYHAKSPASRGAEIIEILSDTDVALVTDAGTPAVSDPGGELVDLARSSGINVVPIPGPSAVTALLSAAGLRCSRYLFLGFLPRTAGDVRRTLQKELAAGHAVVMFESARRLGKTLGILGELAPDRRVAVGREMTKLHEEIKVGTPEEMSVYYASETRGEVTLLVEAGQPTETPALDDEQVEDLLKEKIASGATRRDAVAQVAEEIGMPKNDVYKLMLEL